MLFAAAKWREILPFLTEEMNKANPFGTLTKHTKLTLYIYRSIV
jgi:hypothetical protein